MPGPSGNVEYFLWLRAQTDRPLAGAAMEAAVAEAGKAIRDFGAEVVVIALGYDAHKDDPIGVLKLEASDFGTIGRQVKGFGLPTLVVQEGGYAIEAIGDCLDAFLGEFK